MLKLLFFFYKDVIRTALWTFLWFASAFLCITALFTSPCRHACITSISQVLKIGWNGLPSLSCRQTFYLGRASIPAGCFVACETTSSLLATILCHTPLGASTVTPALRPMHSSLPLSMQKVPSPSWTKNLWSPSGCL